LAEAAVAAALTPEQVADLEPLAVMRAIMRQRFQAGDHVGALAAATAAAPYVHARLAQTEVSVHHHVAQTDAELAAEIAALEAKLAASITLPLPAPAPVVIEAEVIEAETLN
jgi:hypothetical protein